MKLSEYNAALAAILVAAAETEPAPFPESYGYTALGSDLKKWQMIRGILITGQLATMDGNQIKLTDAGRDMARKCQAFAAA